jgi:hypothetical protein
MPKTLDDKMDVRSDIEQLKQDISTIKTEYHTDRTWLFRYFYLFIGAIAVVLAILYGTTTAEIGRKITETLSGTAVKQASDSAIVLLSRVSASNHEVERIVRILKANIPARIVTGETSPSDTPWESYADGIRVHINTTSYHFGSTPQYHFALVGRGYHWSVLGVNSTYEAASTGFDVYLRPFEPKKPDVKLDPAFAKQNGWHIQWFAFAPQ